MVQWRVHPDVPVFYIDHTADIGIQIFGVTFAELLNRAVGTLAEILVGTCPEHTDTFIDITIDAPTADDLLVDLLRDQLAVLHDRRILCTGADCIRCDTTGGRYLYRGQLKGTAAYPELQTEIKLITYHQLTVQNTPDGWRGQVIFDV